MNKKSKRSPDKEKSIPVPYAFAKPDKAAIRVQRIAHRLRVHYHYHPDYELVYAPAGAGRWQVGDASGICDRPRVLLLGPQVAHAWFSEQAGRQSPGSEATVITFSKERLGLELLGRPLFAPVNALLRSAERGLLFEGRAIQQTAPLMHALHDESALRQYVILLDVLSILAESGRGYALVSDDYSISERERDHRRLAIVMDYVSLHYSESIELAAAARQAGMSVSHFCAFFKRMTGLTFVQYVNRWRIEHACLLLRNTHDKILTIALNAGFNNLSNFNRRFVEQQGMSPREYRAAGQATV